MNSFQELGAALLLLFGGDGPAAERAGDRLLGERIDLAVEEGGFDAIAYGDWQKAPGGLGQLVFDDVRIGRGGGSVAVATARLAVFSQRMEFTDGTFGWEAVPRAWHFEHVEIVREGLFRRTLRIVARDLVPEPEAAAAPCSVPVDFGCELARVPAGPLARFELLFRPPERGVALAMSWRSESGCRRARTAAGADHGDLAAWGRAFLEAPERVEFTVSEVACEGEAAADGGAVGTIGGAEFVAVLPDLSHALFGLVAESHAYLLE